MNFQREPFKHSQWWWLAIQSFIVYSFHVAWPFRTTECRRWINVNLLRWFFIMRYVNESKRKLSLFVMIKSIDEKWIISHGFLSLNVPPGVYITPQLIALTDQQRWSQKTLGEKIYLRLFIFYEKWNFCFYWNLSRDVSCLNDFANKVQTWKLNDYIEWIGVTFRF